MEYPLLVENIADITIYDLEDILSELQSDDWCFLKRTCDGIISCNGCALDNRNIDEAIQKNPEYFIKLIEEL
jgi:hypothetical protein